MLISKSAQHALRALIYLVTQNERRYVSVKEISEHTDVFPAFLGKIVQRLTQAGILETKKGPHGGVALAKPAGEVNLLQVVEALDGTALWNRCVLGLGSCGQRPACPLHEEWANIRARIRALLEWRTLADLALRVKEKPLRIRNQP